jgi:hypothetical protein
MYFNLVDIEVWVKIGISAPTVAVQFEAAVLWWRLIVVSCFSVGRTSENGYVSLLDVFSFWLMSEYEQLTKWHTHRHLSVMHRHNTNSAYRKIYFFWRDSAPANSKSERDALVVLVRQLVVGRLNGAVETLVFHTQFSQPHEWNLILLSFLLEKHFKFFFKFV